MKRKLAGFSMIELLVAISIVAILALVVTTNYSRVQASARDQVRSSDLGQIQLALTLYKQEHGSYPDATHNGGICSDITRCQQPLNAISQIISDYGGLAVADPRQGETGFAYQYNYQLDCDGSYNVTVLYARMEQESAGNWTEVRSRCSALLPTGTVADQILILEFRD